jgi:intracellular sulfur oxidation DsrE/DsrF family protein
MNKRHLLSFLAALVFSASALAQTASQATSSKASQPAKLVIQVSDAEPAKWNLALNNARNVQEELGAKNVEIEIVAYGPGLGMLKKDAVTSGRLDEATMAGIKVVACENTMRNQKLTRADIHAAASYAPSGVVQLMQRQSQGWAYVRP